MAAGINYFSLGQNQADQAYMQKVIRHLVDKKRRAGPIDLSIVNKLLTKTLKIVGIQFKFDKLSSKSSASSKIRNWPPISAGNDMASTWWGWACKNCRQSCSPLCNFPSYISYPRPVWPRVTVANNHTAALPGEQQRDHHIVNAGPLMLSSCQ
jgi:hypothetical protein